MSALTIESESPPFRVDESGTVRIGQTRVTIGVVVDAFLSGMTPEAIAEEYDTLALSDVYATIAYYLRHRQVVDDYLNERRAESDAQRREVTSGPDYALWRKRLLDRAKSAGLGA